MHTKKRTKLKSQFIQEDLYVVLIIRIWVFQQKRQCITQLDSRNKCIKKKKKDKKKNQKIKGCSNFKKIHVMWTIYARQLSNSGHH